MEYFWWYVMLGIYIVLFLLGYWKISSIDRKTDEMYDEIKERLKGKKK